MRNDIFEYVKQCMKCKKIKTPTHKYQKLTSIEVGQPVHTWAADIAFLRLSHRGNKYLLVFMDYFTKWTVTAALPSFDTDAVANVMICSIILVFDCPSKFITDNGKNFVSEAMKVICQRMGINKRETSVEHPQSDGLVERMNRTMKSALSIYCQEDPATWDDYLPFVTFGINTSKQVSTGYSPYEIMFGRKAILPALAELPSVQQYNNYDTTTWMAYLNHYIPVLLNDVKKNIK